MLELPEPKPTPSPSPSPKPSFRWQSQVTDEVVDQIREIGLRKHPLEACGVLFPTFPSSAEVFNLPNRAEPKDQLDSCLIYPRDVEEALLGWLQSLSDRNIPAPDPAQAECLGIILWHTHPKGGVGPSQQDLRHRIRPPRELPGFLPHLVVSLPNGPAVRY